MIAATLPDPEIDPQFYAGVPARRVVAFVVDLVVILVIDAALLVLFAAIGVFTFGIGWVMALPALLVSGFLYRWLMLSAGSATVGMYLAGIEIRGPDGNRLTGGRAFVHTAAFHVSLLSVVLMLISFGTVLVTPRGQTLHDLLAGTAAINRPA